MLSRLSILKKGLLLIAVPLCFQLGFIALVALMRRDAITAEGWMVHTKDVFVQGEALKARLFTAHGSVQGYIITQDPAFDRQSVADIRALDAEAAKLTLLVGDNASQQAVARRIEGNVNRFSRFQDEGVRLVREGRLDLARAADRRKSAQVELDAMSLDLKSFLDEERRLDQVRQGRLARSWSWFDLLLGAGSLMSILFTILVAILFSRSISGRISVLASNAHRLAEGKELAPSLGGRDELARLDAVFHEMARTLDSAARAEREHARITAVRADELAALNGQLREKNQENEMFVYSVSHDLRSPLVNLQGFSKELGLIGRDLRATIDRDEVPRPVRDRALGMIDVDVAESIGFIQSAVTRLSGIIDALLRLSRAGRVDYRFQPCDVAEIVRRIVSALGQTIHQKGATVTIGDLPPAHGDPTAVEQVLGNLIGNALNYLDPGRPGEITVSAEAASIRHPLAPPGTVIYAVRDNGLGIPDAYKSKIFRAFQRLHGDVAKGEGVGLALVQRVVERHGGRVWFESTAGRGTAFFVALPAEEDPARGGAASVLSSGIESK